MIEKQIELKDFARRVERFCDFFLEQIPKGEKAGSIDLKVIEDLKNDCADIQADKLYVTSLALDEVTFTGLHDHMRGTEL